MRHEVLSEISSSRSESAVSPIGRVACLTAIFGAVRVRRGSAPILVRAVAELKGAFGTVKAGHLRSDHLGTGDDASTMMTGTNDALHLSLEAEAENIPLARAAVADMAESLGMGEPWLGDLKTVVSEACTNVVRHAYPGGGGEFELDARTDGSAITVVVRDFGVGLRPRIEPGPSLRLGLGLISTLADRYEIFGHPGGGTEVRISMPLH
jgi:serine/threonine-protein kinase RsbW